MEIRARALLNKGKKAKRERAKRLSKAVGKWPLIFLIILLGLPPWGRVLGQDLLLAPGQAGRSSWV